MTELLSTVIFESIKLVNYYFVNDNNIIDKNIKKEHIKNIKKNIIDKDPNKCPKCGGQLIERNGKYGKFIGCSNYPRCKFTK